jgi:hypothetical protein
MSDLYRDAEMYEADEGTGSMEQEAERRWVVPVEPDYEGFTDFLHGELCKSNHIDQCAYHYVKWADRDNPNFTVKQRWLDKARAALDAALRRLDDE